MRRAARALAGGFLVAVPALGGCESFDDAVATQGYLDFDGAAAVCARVFTCPGLATSLRRSIGAPIDGVNFSTCLSWLAGPSPTPPGGFDAQAAVLSQVASATSCASAAAGLDVVPFGPQDDALCAGGVTGGCTNGDVFDCTERQIVHCAGQQFEDSTCVSLPPALPVCAVTRCAALPTQIGGCAGGVLCVDRLLPQEAIVCAAFGGQCLLDSVQATSHLDVSVALCTTPTDDGMDPRVCAAQPEGGTTCAADGAMVVCDHVRSGTAVASPPIAYAAVETLYPCQADLGWSCVAPGAGAAPGAIPYCAPPGAACTPEDAGVNTCDGDVIVACVAGASQRIDCSAVGATCQPGVAGVSAGAFCAFGA